MADVDWSEENIKKAAQLNELLAALQQKEEPEKKTKWVGATNAHISTERLIIWVLVGAIAIYNGGGFVTNALVEFQQTQDKIEEFEEQLEELEEELRSSDKRAIKVIEEKISGVRTNFKVRLENVQKQLETAGQSRDTLEKRLENNSKRVDEVERNRETDVDRFNRLQQTLRNNKVNM